MQFIWPILLCVSLMYGNETLSLPVEGTVSTQSAQSVYEDKNQIFTPGMILQDTLSPSPPKISVSYPTSAFWLKSRIVNRQDKPLQVIFRNPRAGIDYIDVYVYRSDGKVRTHLLGDLRPIEKRELQNRTSAFTIALQAHEEVIIITRLDTTGSLDLYWIVYPLKDFSRQNSLELIFWGLFGGLVLALAIYNLVVGLSFKEWVFAAYIAHALALLWTNYCIHGLLYLFNTGIDLHQLNLTAWYVPSLVPVFLNLFTILFFRLHRTHRIYFILLSLFTGVYLGFALLYLFGISYPELLILGRVGFYPLIINILLVITVGIWAFRQKIRGSSYFLLAEGIYLLTLIYFMSAVVGLVPLNTLASIATPLGALFEMIFQSVALASRITALREEHTKSREMLLREKSFNNIGRIIAGVSHQWRQPFSRLCAHFMYLQTASTMQDDKTLGQSCRETLPDIHYAIEHMQSTLQLFDGFYGHENKPECFKLDEELKRTASFYEQKAILEHVNIHIDSSSIPLETHRWAITNVLLILFENSFDNFKRQNHPSGEITLQAECRKSEVKLRFSDNGGGIRDIPPQELFERKHSKKGYGLGLYLARMMVEEKLDGSITVSNMDTGVEFAITLPAIKEKAKAKGKMVEMEI